MIPILICLPFWKGDQTQAIALCKIIAGLQPGHAGNLAHILLVARQDCKIDQNMINIVSPKFNVFTYKSQSPLKGWPQGANGIFGSTMIHIANFFKNKYECVYWMEPDAIPICPNWFWSLVLEWRKKHPKALVVGSRSDCNGDGTGDHISGSCLYHPNIARLMPFITTSSNVAWDYQHRVKMVESGGNTNIIQQRYHQKGLPPGVIEEPGVVVIHGCKDDSIVKAVKKKFKIL